MAKRIMLPSVKVRQRSTAGKSTFKRIPRGSLNLKRELPVSHDDTRSKVPKIHVDSGLEEKCNDYTMVDELPSLYSMKQRVAADAWEAVRKKLRDACIESTPLPDEQLCIHCSMVEAQMWCRRCGACAYFCKECWSSCHAKLNIFHTPVTWEVSV